VSQLPTGTVTFMFTDIEGSTRLVQELGEGWKPVLETHDGLVTSAVANNGGAVVRTEGDAVFAVFEEAHDAVACAVDAQRALAGHEWQFDGGIRIRIGLHTGTGSLGGADYVGIDVHRAARVSAAGHGGQIVLSEATGPLVERGLPEGTTLLDLGKHRLKDLAEAETLFQVSIDGLPAEFPPLNTLERVSHNLPVQVTSFVGREDDVSEAMRLLESSRILTLLGPGGTGKTRLALQVAAESADAFGDGVYFVALDPVEEPQIVASAILGALGVPASPGGRHPREHLVGFLAHKEVLLVLDNFEHLLEAADLVAELARTSVASKVLVTSRIPLRISGEQEMQVPPLEVSGDATLDELVASEAVQLFVDRVSLFHPGFAVTEENAEAVAELVRRLDGLPLAIELIAPQLRILPVADVVRRLDTGSLGGGARDMPERHRSLRNAVAWSVDSLTPKARHLFEHLSIFAGSARIEEIEAVCDQVAGDLIEVVAELVEGSLLRRSTSGTSRFEILSVMRDYGEELLDASGQRAEVESKHAMAYLQYAEEGAGQLTGRERGRWLAAFQMDHDNFRNAHSWLVENRLVDEALRLSWAMWRFWQAKSHTHEARRRIEASLALEGGEPGNRAKAIEALGGILWWLGDIAGSRDKYGAALQIQRELGDKREIANALYNLGLGVAFSEDPDLEEAKSLLQEAEAIFEKLGDTGGLGDVHWGMANLSILIDEDPGPAAPYLEKAAAEYAAAGNLFGEGWVLFERANALFRLGEYAEAEENLRKGFQLLYGSGDESSVSLFFALIAQIAMESGELDRAYRLAGAAWESRDRTGVDLISVEANQLAGGLQLEELEALTGEYAEAYREGRAMTSDQAIEYAFGP
jgi:predicted ATPase/class 3 adenylate cyclase